jgi:hypothetical protein
LKLYLSNRMRGAAHMNWDWFIENARTLRAKGHEVVNPTEIDEEAGVVFVEYDTDGSISDVRLTSLYDYNEVMRRDLAAVADCDGIVMGPDWRHSVGARNELAAARMYDLAVFYGVESVPSVYPILCAEDEMRHQQRTAMPQAVLDAIDRSEGISQEEWDATVNGEIRTFESGAIRDGNPDRKYDYSGFMSPLVVKEFARYMHKHRLLPNGSVRASDNWQNGMPREECMSSLWRHFHDVWTAARGYVPVDFDGNEVDELEALMAVWFNVQVMALGIIEERSSNRKAG